VVEARPLQWKLADRCWWRSGAWPVPCSQVPCSPVPCSPVPWSPVPCSLEAGAAEPARKTRAFPGTVAIGPLRLFAFDRWLRYYLSRGAHRTRGNSPSWAVSRWSLVPLRGLVAGGRLADEECGPGGTPRGCGGRSLFGRWGAPAPVVNRVGRGPTMQLEPAAGGIHEGP
jgi:hypothetical protein